LPVLAAVDAVVHLQSARSARQVPLTQFYTGYRATVRQQDELIIGFEIPAVRGRQAFRKVGTRAAQAIAKIVVAGVWDTVRGEARPRLAMGSVAPTPLRLSQTERALGSGASLADAQQIVQREIAPIDDLRSTAEYRRQVAANLVGQFYGEARKR
jgi:CO/xanthine dehydrogenase FAD-binding subunit